MVRLSTVMLLLFPVVALAQERVELKPRYQAGMKWTFDSNSDMTNNSRVTAEGLPPQQMNQRMTQARKGTVEVLEVKDGLPSAVRAEFDPACEGSMEQNGQTQKAPFPLAGKTVTVRRDADGKISHDFTGQLDEQTQNDLNQLVDVDSGMFPQRPVAVGDGWDARTEKLRRVYQLGAQDQVSVQCKLMAIKQQDGRKVADVAVIAKITKQMGPMTMSMQLGGVSCVDVETGRPMTDDLVGSSKIAGSQTAPGPNGQQVAMKMDGDGKMQMRNVSKLLATGGAAAPVAPAQPPFGDVRPPVAPAAGSFTGTFKSDRLTLTFENSSAGQCSGTIQMGAQKFPFKATINGNKLDGSFESGGNSFPFTATLDGQTLSLTTGNTTHMLKKQAANPLDNPPPPNPLERGAAPLELRSLHNIDKFAEARNRAEGYERCQAVPLRELNR